MAQDVELDLMPALVSAGLLTEEQAEGFKQESLAEGSVKPPYWYAGRARLVTMPDIRRAFASERGFTYADLTTAPLHSVANTLIPIAKARSLVAVAFDLEDEYLKVAVEDPNDMEHTYQVRSILGSDYRIDFQYGTNKEIGNYLTRIESGEDDTASASETVPSPRTRREARSGGAPVREIRQTSTTDGGDVILENLIQRAVDDRASDIHVEPQADSVRIRFRIDAVLQTVARYDRDVLDELISVIKIRSGKDPSQHNQPQSGRMTQTVRGRAIDARVEAIPTQIGESAVIRLLDSSGAPQSIDELGFSPRNKAAFIKALSRTRGLVVVTGPTGSGKTVTLYAAVEFLATEDRKVITIEDPVERQFAGITQIQVDDGQKRSFVESLRSVLRQDPDVVLLGEIRDDETATTAVKAANTGHIVLTTLHTNDSPSSARRLVDLGVPAYLVGSSISCVVAQRLARRLCENCRVEEPYDPAIALGFNDDGQDPAPEFIYSARDGGCESCSHTGYLGRIALHEVMPVDSTIQSMMNHNAEPSEIREAAAKRGMRSVLQDGWDKVKAGLTSVVEVHRAADEDEA